MLHFEKFTVAKLCFNSAKHKALQWSAKRPVFVLSLIIGISVVLLPAVTVAALTPVALVFTYTGILASKGGFNVLYAVLFQGFVIATVIVGLFMVFFTLAIFLSVLHSYRSFFQRFIPHKGKRI